MASRSPRPPVIIGIDFGTYTTVVAYKEGSKPTVTLSIWTGASTGFRTPHGELPSTIIYKSGENQEQVLIGHDVTKYRGAGEPVQYLKMALYSDSSSTLRTIAENGFSKLGMELETVLADFMRAVLLRVVNSAGFPTDDNAFVIVVGVPSDLDNVGRDTLRIAVLNASKTAFGNQAISVELQSEVMAATIEALPASQGRAMHCIVVDGGGGTLSFQSVLYMTEHTEGRDDKILYATAPQRTTLYGGERFTNAYTTCVKEYFGNLKEPDQQALSNHWQECWRSLPVEEWDGNPCANSAVIEQMSKLTSPWYQIINSALKPLMAAVAASTSEYIHTAVAGFCDLRRKINDVAADDPSALDRMLSCSPIYKPLKPLVVDTQHTLLIAGGQAQDPRLRRVLEDVVTAYNAETHGEEEIVIAVKVAAHTKLVARGLVALADEKAGSQVFNSSYAILGPLEVDYDPSSGMLAPPETDPQGIHRMQRPKIVFRQGTPLHLGFLRRFAFHIDAKEADLPTTRLPDVKLSRLSKTEEWMFDDRPEAGLVREWLDGPSDLKNIMSLQLSGCPLSTDYFEPLGTSGHPHPESYYRLEYVVDVLVHFYGFVMSASYAKNGKLILSTERGYLPEKL